jgi:peptidoglycan/xylan/chitin deacetylase (PgdA/CDA1 family)
VRLAPNLGRGRAVVRLVMPMELTRNGLKRQLKSWVRDQLASSMQRLGVTRPDRIAKKRLTIVTFHRVLPESLRRRYPYPNLAVTPEELDWFLGYFKRWFQVGSMAEVLPSFRAGVAERRPLAVTFDDGQRDNHEHALPVLRKHGVHATFYIPVDAVQRSELIWHDRLGFALLDALEAGAAAKPELVRILSPLRADALRALDSSDRIAAMSDIAAAFKRLDAAQREATIAELQRRFASDEPRGWADLMSFDEIRHLADEGHEIGSHSLTHPFMTRCNDAELERELVESKRILERELERPVLSFCYPDGNSDARTQDAARRAGYDNAVTTRWGNNPAAVPAFALRRHDMSNKHALSAQGHFSDALLSWRMSGLQPGLR